MDLLGHIKVPTVKEEYIGDDGLKRCCQCHKQTEHIINFLGEQKKVRCICDCIEKEIEKQKEKEKREEIDRMRKVCFAETNMANWNFQNDDRRNEKLSDAMKRYADNFDQMKKDGKGLLLWGGVGTGKTYYASCIANALLDKGHPVLMTNFSRLINKIQGMFDGKQEYIDSLNRYSLLIIDDLGAESKSDFRKELIFNIIDSRYRSGLPFIVTSNLTLNELRKAEDLENARAYDRVLERCFPIEVNMVSRRKEKLLNTYHETKEILGL